MTDLLLPRRARGRPSPNAEATYQEQRQAFCALIQEIWSTMDFAVGVHGWCYILEGRGHATKGEFDACENFITDCRKTGDLSAPVGWSPDNLIIERFGLNFDFIEANNLTWIDNLETSSGQRLDDPRHPDHFKPYVQSYLAAFGARKCEANALVVAPEIGRQLCRDAILRYVDATAPRRYQRRLESAQRDLRRIINDLLAMTARKHNRTDCARWCRKRSSFICRPSNSKS